MVGHHVTQGTRFLVKTPAGPDPDRFGRGDLHVINMITIPNRLKDAVGKAQRQDTLDRVFSQKMVDPENLIFAQRPQKAGIQITSRLQAVPERLLYDDPSPISARVSAAGLLSGQVRGAQQVRRATGRRAPDRRWLETAGAW